MPRIAIALLICAAAAGCGGDGSGTSAGGDPHSEVDEVTVRTISEDYMTSIASNDWETACGLMTAAQRKRTAAEGGGSSCPKALKTLVVERKTLDQAALKSYQSTVVTFDGKRATVAGNVPGPPTVLLKQGPNWAIDQP